MRRNDDRPLLLMGDRKQHMKEPVGIGAIQMGRRLVTDKNRRGCHKGPEDAYPLFLAFRKGCHLLVKKVEDSEDMGFLLDSHLIDPLFSDEPRKGDILHHIEIVEKERLAEHESEALVPESIDFLLRLPLDFHSVIEDLSLEIQVDKGKKIHERRLSASALADYGIDLSFLEKKVGIREERPVGKAFRQVLRLYCHFFFPP